MEEPADERARRPSRCCLGIAVGLAVVGCGEQRAEVAPATPVLEAVSQEVESLDDPRIEALAERLRREIIEPLIGEGDEAG